MKDLRKQEEAKKKEGNGTTAVKLPAMEGNSNGSAVAGHPEIIKEQPATKHEDLMIQQKA